jgi:hypothetical protein
MSASHSCLSVYSMYAHSCLSMYNMYARTHIHKNTHGPRETRCWLSCTKLGDVWPATAYTQVNVRKMHMFHMLPRRYTRKHIHAHTHTHSWLNPHSDRQSINPEYAHTCMLTQKQKYAHGSTESCSLPFRAKMGTVIGYLKRMRMVSWEHVDKNTSIRTWLYRKLFAVISPENGRGL